MSKIPQICRIHRPVATLLTACLLLVTHACSQEVARVAQRIKVGYIEFVTDLPFFVAMEKGYFAKRNLEVQPVKAGDSSEAMNLLLAGQVDAVAHLAFSVFWTAEDKAPGRVKLFLPCYETGDVPVSYLLVRSESPIRQVSELRGKRIGTITGITQLVYLKLFLADLGLDPSKDVTILQVSPTLQVQALQANQFEVLFTVDPYGAIALQRGTARLLLPNPRSRHIVDPFWAAAAGMSSRLASDRSSAGSLYAGMAEAVDFIRADTRAARSILPKYTPLDSAIADMVGIYQYAQVSEVTNYTKMQDLADKMLQYGALKKRVDVGSLLLQGPDLSAQ